LLKEANTPAGIASSGFLPRPVRHVSKSPLLASCCTGY